MALLLPSTFGRGLEIVRYFANDAWGAVGASTRTGSRAAATAGPLWLQVRGCTVQLVELSPATTCLAVHAEFHSETPQLLGDLFIVHGINVGLGGREHVVNLVAH